jgi:hypothetical protein
MTVALLGEVLTANESDMTVSYNLVKYGEEGRTNKGRVTVAPGTIEIPSGHLPMNDEHANDKNVGYLTASEADDMVTATVQYYNTPEGERAFDDASSGKRRGISMELLNPVINGGKLLAGRLCAAAIVEKPAFPSSMLLASDVGEIAADLADAAAALEAGDYAAVAAAIEAAQAKAAEAEAEESEPNKEETNVPKLEASAKSSAPANTDALLAALANITAPKPDADADKLKASESAITLDKFTAALRGMADTTDGRLKAAALDTITQADVYDPTSVPAYLGEVWAKQPYEEIYTPLVTHENLTGMRVEGWRWVEGKSPIVDDWEPAYSGVAPNESMNDIPTGEVVAEPYAETAKRIAGGNRFDRVHIDFPVPGVLESFLREQAEYIARRRDARTKEHIYANAKDVVATGTDAANAWRRIILGAMHVMEYSTPSYAVVGNDLYRDMLGSDMLENLALLETSLGLKEGSMAGFKIKPASITDVASNGKVVVGTARATVLHEPAGAPFRVDAQELIKGAVDKAVFAYYLLRSDERGGIVNVTTGV